MHPRLRQDVETHYTGDEDINTVIPRAKRLDSIHRSTKAYGKERYDKEPKESTYKKAEHKPKKRFNHGGNSAKKKEQRKKGAGFTCGGEGHMAKDCPSKKDNGKAKVKQEAPSNLATELCEYDEVYIKHWNSRAMRLEKPLALPQSRHSIYLRVLCSLMERKQRSWLIQVRLEQTLLLLPLSLPTVYHAWN